MTNLIELHNILYYFEQQVYSFISDHFYSLDILLPILILTSGVLTSLNPCFISIIPLSISYIYSQKNKTVALTYFITGLTISLLTLIISIYYIHYKSNWLIQSLPIISSTIMIFYGLSLLEIFNIAALIPINLQNIKLPKKYNNYQTVIAGMTIGFTSTPCSTPIMATVLFGISSKYNFTLGLIYILFYIVGLIIPTIIVLVFTIKNQLFIFVNLVWSKITALSGCFILAIGILSFLNKTFT